MTLAADSAVSIEIAGERLDALKEYEVRTNVLTQPAAFGCKVGSGTTVRALLEKFKPGQEYKLFVGEVLQHSGLLDEVSASDGSGATELYLRGRDYLAAAHDDQFDADRSFSNLTFIQLANEILTLSGLSDFSVVTDSVGNRAAIADVPETVLAPLLPADAAAAARAGQPVEGPIAIGVRRQQLRAKVGETRFSFLEEQLKRAGLFFYAGADERVFILTTVHATQAPIYSLIRRPFLSDVKLHRFRNATQGRHARYTVFGRGGSAEGGRGQVKGVFEDTEISDLGFTKGFCTEAKDAKSQSQAEYLARRKCAEARRSGWSLGYTVTGHTAPSLVMAGRRHVWSVDTMVFVDDEEIGIRGPHWIEGVIFRGSPSAGTTTELSLMRPEDLVFGDAA